MYFKFSHNSENSGFYSSAMSRSCKNAHSSRSLIFVILAPKKRTKELSNIRFNLENPDCSTFTKIVKVNLWRLFGNFGQSYFLIDMGNTI